MVVKAGTEETLIVSKRSMHSIKVINNTTDNDIDVQHEEGKLKTKSLSNKEFAYRYTRGGFPIRTDELIFADEVVD